MTSNIYDSLMFALVDGLSSVFVAILLWYGSAQMGEVLGFGSIASKRWIDGGFCGLSQSLVDTSSRYLTKDVGDSTCIGGGDEDLWIGRRRGTDGYDRYKIDQCIWKDPTAKCSFLLIRMKQTMY